MTTISSLRISTNRAVLKKYRGSLSDFERYLVSLKNKDAYEEQEKSDD